MNRKLVEKVIGKPAIELVLKIKPCMPKYKPSYGKTADGSIDQQLFVW
jgi:hypothetical protein